MKNSRLMMLLAIVLFIAKANAQTIHETNYYPKLQTNNNEVGKVQMDIALQLAYENLHQKDILVLLDLGSKTEIKEITGTNWKNKSLYLPGDYSVLISSATNSNTQANIFSHTKALNGWAISQAETKKPLNMDYTGMVNNKVHFNMFEENKNGNGNTTKIWKPDKLYLIMGSIFTLAGAAALFIPPFPDPFLDAEDGPLALAVFGFTFTSFGVGFIIGGLAHTVTVNQPNIDPSIASDQLKLSTSEENNRVKASLTQLFNQGHIKVNDNANHLKGYPKHAFASDDRIEFEINNKKSIFYYNNLYFNSLTRDGDVRKILFVGNFEFKLDRKKNSGSLNALDSYFRYIRDQIYRQAKEHIFTEQLEVFKPVAAKYRALSVKPSVSEEQRKYIVQANSFNEEKQYTKAIEFYNKAIEVDQTAYPAAYSNLALLSAQLNQFDAAIYYMKKYLMLEPESPDARSAQDKIYEWEILMQK